MPNHFVLIAGVSFIIAGFVIYFKVLNKELIAFYRQKATQFRSAPKSMLTPNEIHFYGLLKRACTTLDLEISSQVSMGALISTAGSSSDPDFWAQRNRFASKIVDFVIYDIKRNSRVLALVELDDKTHVKEKDTLRDSFTSSLGFKTLRYESTAKPSIEQLMSDLRALK